MNKKSYRHIKKEFLQEVVNSIDHLENLKSDDLENCI
jgi:hypothetical protein